MASPGEIFEGGSISVFAEYGKQSAITRLSREWLTNDEHYRYEDEAYAKVTQNHLKTNVRAYARTLQARSLEVLLRALEQGRTKLEPPLRRKDKLTTKRSPAGLNPAQSPCPPSVREMSRSSSEIFMTKIIGTILSGQAEDGCAVRFTGAPGSGKDITKTTLMHLLSSKVGGIRFTTQSKEVLYQRAAKHKKTKFFFPLPTSSVSRLVVAPTTNVKRGEFLAYDLKPGDIIAAPWQLNDVSGGETYLLGEVGETGEKLSATFLSDGLSSDYFWDDQEMTRILKVNDVNTGDLFKTCGTHVIGRRLFYRDASVGAEKYLPALISGYDTTTQQHKLQLLPDQTEPPLPTTPAGSPISVDLSKADVRLVRPPATGIPVAATAVTPSSPTLAPRTTRAAAARNIAQTPVHNHTAHNDNSTTLTESFAPSSPKGKRLSITTNDIPSPPSAKRKTGKAHVAKKTTHGLNKKENPTNDALLLAFEDPAPAPITSPFSVDSPHDLAPDHELSADLPGSLLAPRATVASLPPDPFPELVPDDDDDVSLDVLMAELAPKRTLLSSRSTDAKSSETPVADDVPPSSNSSPGKKQRATKKMKRER